ncbi:hypothetical protein B5F53_00840 [Blautia sp. An249]|uniref:AEC family transporter n=1 Tax=Blautia sp. An249 TaxID=1965603 RepID=UPI000B3A8BA0|nr:AEC family transporter [Blautia sp. An249]OUO81156.1 hypothetical protein B5F53_00840 [Blautia sp. An249]
MEYLSFGIRMTVPMFLVMAVGGFLFHRGVVSEDYAKRTNQVVFQTALPAMLFQDIAETDPQSLMDGKLILAGLLGTLLVFLISWGLAEKTIGIPGKVGAFVHGSYRGNFVYIGLPLIMNILGRDTLTCAPSVIATVLPAYNIFAVFILTIKNKNAQKVQVGKIALEILKNPMILAILAGLPFSIWQISLPYVLDQAVGYLGDLAMPLALLLIGMNIHVKNLKSHWKITAMACVCKLVLSPAVGLCLGWLLGVSNEAMVTLFVLFSVPSAANSYIMTRSMNGDGELASSIVAGTTLVSVITLAVGISVLKMVQIA